jgi:NAD(P)-dependent dehydrogenase (short-subunit alcohol dehydrogenase family)
VSTLDGRVALITGGSRGIGRATSLCLAQEGADVAINYRSDEAAARATQQQVEALGRRARLYPCDVSQSYDAVKAMADQVVRDFGHMDILVNNAGVDMLQRQAVCDTDIAVLHRIFNTNLFGAYYCTKAAIPHLRQGRRGDIIFISSEMLERIPPNRAAYAASKAALETLATSVSKEERANGIRANVIRSSVVETEMGKRVFQRRGFSDMKDVYARAPFGRVAQPEDIGNLVAFLCSQRGEHITGATILAGGGILDWLP